MNMKEIVHNTKREILDALKGIDSHPEHILSFPAHTGKCSRTQPLVLNTVLKVKLGAAMWNTTAERIVIGETCPECTGTISFR